MLEKHVEGEPQAFAQCRQALWRLCEVSTQRIKRIKGEDRMHTKTKINAFVEPATWQEFKALANAKGMKLSAFTEQAIKEKIEKEKKA